MAVATDAHEVTSERRTKQGGRHSLLVLAMLVLIYAPIGTFLAYFSNWQWIWLAFFPVDFFIFPLCFIALHEGGHVLMGRLVGYELREIAIGPLLLQATAQGVRFSLRRDAF